MKLRYIWVGVLGFLILQTNVSAQESIDTTIREQRLEFFQVYKPEIEQPRKREVSANLPNTKPTQPTFHYTVPQQTLSYTYKSVPIRPMALGRQDKLVDFQNYAQLGLGNKTGMLFDLGLASIKDENYDVIFHAKHFSQRYNPKIQVDAKTDVALGGIYHFDKHDIGIKADYNRYGMRYFGYDQDSYNVVSDRNKQVYSTVGVGLHMKNTAPVLWAFEYAPEIEFKNYQDRWDHIEKQVNFKAPFTYPIDENIQLGLGFEGRFASYEGDSFNGWNNLFSIRPSFKYFNDKVHVNAALSNTYGQGGNVYWSPDLYAQFIFSEDKFKLDFGWKADVLQNTFEELSTINPFIYGLKQIKQSKADQVFLGFESKWKSKLTFGAQFSWRQWSNMPMFINDYSIVPEGRRFDITYVSKVQAINPEGYIQYQVGPNFGVKGYISYMDYYMVEGFDKMYHMPKTKIGGMVMAKLFDQLTIEGQVDFWNGMYGKPDRINVGFEKLSPFMDIQIRGEYEFLDRWSVFLNVNNLLNQQYQRWMQYDNFGINFIGGVRFKF